MDVVGAFAGVKRSFFERSAPAVAPELLGARLFASDGVVVRINETEAYTQDDPASHSFRGQTQRNAVMFGPPGYLYVYFIYGMHWCANITTGPVGEGAAVLIRGAIVEAGLDLVRTRRGARVRERDLTNGPAKLCQALAINGTHNGIDLCSSAGDFRIGPRRTTAAFSATARIGVSQGKATMWRFLET